MKRITIQYSILKAWHLKKMTTDFTSNCKITAAGHGFSGSKNSVGLKTSHLQYFFTVFLKLCSCSNRKNAKPGL